MAVGEYCQEPCLGLTAEAGGPPEPPAQAPPSPSPAALPPQGHGNVPYHSVHKPDRNAHLPSSVQRCAAQTESGTPRSASWRVHSRQLRLGSVLGRRSTSSAKQLCECWLVMPAPGIPLQTGKRTSRIFTELHRAEYMGLQLRVGTKPKSFKTLCSCLELDWSEARRLQLLDLPHRLRST